MKEIKCFECIRIVHSPKGVKDLLKIPAAGAQGQFMAASHTKLVSSLHFCLTLYALSLASPLQFHTACDFNLWHHIWIVFWAASRLSWGSTKLPSATNQKSLPFYQRSNKMMSDAETQTVNNRWGEENRLKMRQNKIPLILITMCFLFQIPVVF